MLWVQMFLCVSFEVCWVWSARMSHNFNPLSVGYDVIAQAQSGTGKTATFAISILQQIDIEMKATQAMVLAPTRELAQQVRSSTVLMFNYIHVRRYHGNKGCARRYPASLDI